MTGANDSLRKDGQNVNVNVKSKLVEPTITRKSLMRCTCRLCEQNVFNECLKLLSDRSDPRKRSGREFQADGPAQEKVRLPYVDR